MYFIINICILRSRFIDFFFFRGKNGNMKEVGIFSGAVEALLLRNIFIPFLFFENGLSISWKDLG